MENKKIYSPNGIPNKEKYLNEELAKLHLKEIFLIEKRENGDLNLLVEDTDCEKKYFVKVVKTTEGKLNINEVTKEKWYTEILKSAISVDHVEYKDFSVLFFRKK